MNAKTFVSNAEGQTERIEITELERAAGRTVRIMFETKDDLVLYMDEKGNVLASFYGRDGLQKTVTISSKIWHALGGRVLDGNETEEV